MDTLFRFEFDEGYKVNALVVRADTFTDAISQASLILGDYCLKYHLCSIHKIN